AGGAPPFGTRFSNKVDFTNVGTMGHSRGGEGVAEHYVFNANLSDPPPFGIKAVLPLAPVNFTRQLLNNTSIQVILPYCDGDGSDLQGAHYFDDARFVLGDPAPKHSTLVMGGNHNFFNTVWTPGGWPAGTADDWTDYLPSRASDPFCGPSVSGNGRLTAS